MTFLFSVCLVLVAPLPLFHPVLNTSIWAVGLVLQCALAGLIFWRGVARRAPGFTVLMIFYPLRSLAAFILSGRMEGRAYDDVSNLLAVVEFLLQLLVVFELVFHFRRESSVSRWFRALLPLLLLVSAGCLAGMTFKMLPQHLPADHLQIFMGFVLIVLGTVFARNMQPGNRKRMAEGLALYSLIQFVALAGRAHAFLERQTDGYLAWSYVPACGYMLVVLFWIFMLQREQ